MAGHRVETSRLVAVEPTQAFERMLAARQSEVFSHRYAAFPAIREVTGEPEAWGVVGQSRTLVLTDGGGMRQTITAVDGPRSYAYVLDEIQGSLRPFVRTVDGVWSVTPEGTGARIGWAWTMHPKAPPARLTMNVIGRMWKGYADRALVELEAVLMRD